MRARTSILLGVASAAILGVAALLLFGWSGRGGDPTEPTAILPRPPVAAPPPEAGDARIRKLVAGLGRTETQKAARAELLSIGSSATAVLFECMQDGDPVIRWELASLQGEIKDTRALMPLVVAVLNDPHEAVRERAMWALEQFDERRSAIAQLQQSLSSGDEEIRWRAALALAQLGIRDGLAIIREGLENPERRGLALKSIVEIVDEEALVDIARIYPELDTIDRQQAIMIFGKHGGKVAIDALVSALDDPQSEVRWRVCYFLARVGDQSAIGALKTLKIVETDERVLKHVDRALAALERLRR